MLGGLGFRPQGVHPKSFVDGDLRKKVRISAEKRVFCEKGQWPAGVIP
jgi:hypothetical protein